MRAKEPIKKICEFCGREFDAYTQNARYCSHDCNRKAYREIKRKEVISLTSTIASQTKRERTKTDLTGREYISISDAASLMGVSRWTIYRNVVKGIIPAKRLSRRTTLIRKKDIDALFDKIEPYEVTTGERKPIDKWYTIDEVTGKYGILRHSIRRLINAEDIPTKRAGKRTLIAKGKIDAYFRKKGFDSALSNFAEWITTPEIMNIYGMTGNAVRVFVSRYTIPKKRINGVLHYSKQHIDKLKSNNHEESKNNESNVTFSDAQQRKGNVVSRLLSRHTHGDRRNDTQGVSGNVRCSIEKTERGTTNQQGRLTQVQRGGCGNNTPCTNNLCQQTERAIKIGNLHGD